jgi:hypothetical protein
MENSEIKYERKVYKDEITSLVEDNKTKKRPLTEGIDEILDKIEKRVSLLTFESNAFRMNIQNGKVERI